VGGAGGLLYSVLTGMAASALLHTIHSVSEAESSVFTRMEAQQQRWRLSQRQNSFASAQQQQQLSYRIPYKNETLGHENHLLNTIVLYADSGIACVRAGAITGPLCSSLC
jgi:hypothetical protein